MFYRILFALLMLQSLVLPIPSVVDIYIAQPPTGDTMSAAFSAVATFAATAYSFAISWVLPAQPTPVAPVPTGYLVALKMIASQALTFIRCHAACLFPPTPARCPACWAAPAQPSPPSFAASLASIASQAFLIAHSLTARIHATASTALTQTSVSMWGALFVVACCFVTSWVCMAHTQTHLNRQSADISAKVDFILNVMDTWEERITRIQASLRQTTDLSETTAGNACPGCETMAQTLALANSKIGKYGANIDDIFRALDVLITRFDEIDTLRAQITEVSSTVSENMESNRKAIEAPEKSMAELLKEVDDELSQLPSRRQKRKEARSNQSPDRLTCL